MQRLVLTALASLMLAGSVVALADPPKVMKKEGHLTPVRVKVTMVDGSTRTGLATGTWEPGVQATTNDAGGDVQVWLDTLQAISATNNTGATYLFKDGSQRRLNHKYHGDLNLHGANEAVEKVKLAEIKRVDFLGLPRKDREGNAMFDHWQYSPHTGEKLADN